jgi:hypothetical protein
MKRIFERLMVNGVSDQKNSLSQFLFTFLPLYLFTFPYFHLLPFSIPVPVEIQVLSAFYPAPPLPIVQIPPDSLFRSALKIIFLRPAQFLAEFCTVYRVAAVMAWPVFNMLYQRLRLAQFV